jgi:prepilin-type N-terminal cleavage/methylation domain-containing protein
MTIKNLPKYQKRIYNKKKGEYYGNTKSAQNPCGGGVSRGFTLAEGLVTLMIIGVIVAMTIPALRKNAEQREMIAGMKKAYSTMNQIVERSEMDNGSLKRWAYAQNAASVQEYILPYMNIAKDCGSDEACFGPRISFLNGGDAGALYHNPYFIKLTDGTRWIIEGHGGIGASILYINVDVNGDKKPNKAGSDVFIFGIAFKPIDSSEIKIDEPGVYFYGHGLGRSTWESNCKTSGLYCGALIQADGWQIKY